MPDSFEKALEEAILHGKANGGVENEDTLNVIFALKKTLTQQLEAIHQEVRDNRVAVVELFDKHTVAYIHMTPEQFDTWVGKYAADRDLATRKLLDEHHPHRAGEPEESDHTQERKYKEIFIGPRPEDEEIGDMRRGWRIVKWAVMVLAAAAMVWGMTFWADSCASVRAEKNYETGLASPQSFARP